MYRLLWQSLGTLKALVRRKLAGYFCTRLIDGGVLQKKREVDRRSTASECKVMCGIDEHDTWSSDTLVAAPIVGDVDQPADGGGGRERGRRSLRLGRIR